MLIFHICSKILITKFLKHKHYNKVEKRIIISYIIYHIILYYIILYIKCWQRVQRLIGLWFCREDSEKLGQALNK